MKRAIRLALAALAVLVACRREPAEPSPPPTASPASAHEGHGAPAAQATPMPGTTPEGVEIDTRGALNANVRTARVVRRRLVPHVVAAGRVAVDESRLTRLTTWSEGRIQRLFISSAGETIRRGQPVAEIYSPELLTTQRELLAAKESARALAGSTIEGVAADARRLVAASRRRLALAGMPADLIARVERQGRPLEVTPLLSAATGTVTRRLVQVGDWIAKGAAIAEVVDLSRVWVEADVYEYELAGLKPGLPATIVATAYPGTTFHGKVALVQPTITAETRTNGIRIALPNPGGRLKPDMLVTATVTLERGLAIAVPEDAVVDTGKRHVVWVEQHAGRFVPRTVVLGQKDDAGYEVVAGLAEGETIAVSGGFMLDASSQLDRQGGGHAGHGTQSADPHAGHKR